MVCRNCHPYWCTTFHRILSAVKTDGIQSYSAPFPLRGWHAAWQRYYYRHPDLPWRYSNTSVHSALQMEYHLKHSMPPHSSGLRCSWQPPASAQNHSLSGIPDFHCNYNGNFRHQQKKYCIHNFHRSFRRTVFPS